MKTNMADTLTGIYRRAEKLYQSVKGILSGTNKDSNPPESSVVDLGMNQDFPEYVILNSVRICHADLTKFLEKHPSTKLGKKEKVKLDNILCQVRNVAGEIVLGNNFEFGPETKADTLPIKNTYKNSERELRDYIQFYIDSSNKFGIKPRLPDWNI